MGVEIHLDIQAIKKIGQAAVEAAVLTMEQTRTDLVNSATMPFETGDMQNNQTFVAVEGEDTINGEDIYSVSLVTGSPQARRLYYHPEYHFKQDGNGNHGAKWFEPYISGDKKDFVQNTFTEIFKEKSGV